MSWIEKICNVIMSIVCTFIVSYFSRSFITPNEIIIYLSIVFFTMFLLIFSSIGSIIRKKNLKHSFWGIVEGISTIIMVLSLTIGLCDVNTEIRNIIYSIFVISFTCFLINTIIAAYLER